MFVNILALAAQLSYLCMGRNGKELGLEDSTEVDSEVGMRLGLKDGTELGHLDSIELGTKGGIKLGCAGGTELGA
eukprot:12501843-Ditylum_brightwellii.AAC.1